MHQIKEMLKKMGFEIVADEMKTTEYTENSGFIVVKMDNVYHRIDYTLDSYGGELSIDSVREVKPLQVQKVEYV